MAIVGTYTDLVDSAADTASGYLWQAKKNIDEVFGEGYAAKNPELVAAFLRTAITDFSSAVIAKAIDEASDKLDSALSAIAESKR